MKKLLAVLLLAGGLSVLAQSLPVTVMNFDHQPPGVPSMLWPDGFHPYVIVSIDDKAFSKYSVTLVYLDEFYQTRLASQIIANDHTDQMPSAVFVVTAVKVLDVSAYPYVKREKRTASRLIPILD